MIELSASIFENRIKKAPRNCGAFRFDHRGLFSSQTGVDFLFADLTEDLAILLDENG